MTKLPKPSEIIAALRAIGGTSSLTAEQLKALDEVQERQQRNSHVAEPFRSILNAFTSSQ